MSNFSVSSTNARHLLVCIMPKDIQHLTKRRRNQLIYKEINCKTELVKMKYILSTVSNVIPTEAQKVERVAVQYDIFINNTLFTDVNKSNEILEQLEASISSLSNIESDEADAIELQDTDIFENTETSLRTDLQTLIIENNIPHTTANKQLQIKKNMVM